MRPRREVLLTTFADPSTSLSAPEILDAAETQLTFRCGWMSGEPPQPTARRLALAEVGAGPADTSARAAEVAARRAHLRWRWRT